MKKTLTLLLLLFFSHQIYSQKIIENPKTGYTTAPYLIIKKIEITNTSTILSFEISQYAGFRFSIPKETYIKDAASNEKLLIKSAEGVPINDMNVIPESGVINYKLIFGKLDKSVKKIEYGEANDGGNWRIYDIALQHLPNPSGIKTELEGNWYNTENANWEVSFYDTNAIYKSQVWQYDAVVLKKGNGSITLKNKDQKVTLFVKKGKTGNYFIGENPKSLIAFANTIQNLAVKTTNDDKPYELPILKNDSAVYNGYIKNYSKQTNIKTIAIHIDDIITGEQNTQVAKVDENGFFSIKIPLYYPHEVWVRSPVFNGSVFLEPGKTLFQLLGDKNSLYMGESAKINSDLIQFNPRWFNYDEVSSKILDMKPADYKAYCQNLANKEMDKLETLKKTNAIGNKAYQVKKLNIQYDNYEHMLDYSSNFMSAYRNKNKIPREQREINFKMDSLTADYYDFITDELSNNQLAVITNSYRYYLNQLQYLDLINLKSVSTSILEIAAELQKRNYSFTEQEQQLLVDTKEIETLLKSPDHKEFQKKYGKISSAFYTKHQKIVAGIAKEGDFSTLKLEQYLVKNNIPISNEEKEFLVAEKTLAKSASSQKLKQYTSVGKNQSTFYKKHEAISSYLYLEKRTNFRNKKLAELLNVKVGFATDIMASQDVCNKIVSQLTPLSEEDLVLAQKQLKTPFIADYIAKCNNQTIAKIEANKKQTGFVLNETPKTEGDELFASIMKKYKGKVVYVDFWATWCGPCRSGIEQIKPLKEEMAEENVAFVYLTNQTSPENTYSAMIPEIKGEHYRLSADQWNYLSAKFNISGIPHYVLAGKNGEVINPKLGHLDNEELKAELEKRIKE